MARDPKSSSESEGRSHSDFINAFHDAIFVHDASTGKILGLNDRAMEIFGLTRDEFLSLERLDLSDPRRQEVLGWVRKAAEVGPHCLEWQARRKNGERFWCEVSLRKIQNRDAKCLFSVVRDITQRKEAEEALRRSEEQLMDSERLYHSLVQNLPQSIFRKDTSGRFTFANRHFCQSLGKPLDQILGRTDFDLSPAELADRYHRDDCRVLKTQKPLEFTETFRFPDHRRRTVWIVKSPLYDAQGNLTGLQGISWDITEQKQAEEALEEREKKYRTLFDMSPAGIMLEDCNGNILEVNPAMCSMFGYTQEEMRGQNVRMLVPTAQQAEVQEHVDALMAGRTLFHEVINQCKNGDLRRVELHEMSVPLPDGQKGILVIINDITERRQLEEQLLHLQKMESIGQLAAGVAHDFNNILTVINCSATILAEMLAGNAECLDWVHQISISGERAANLTRQLLLFSRKQQMQRQLVNLNELTSNLTKMLGRILGELIHLELSYENDLPFVLGDPNMLEQVITNLAVNARDAMPNGGCLHITTGTVLRTAPSEASFPEPSLFVRLSIRDTGTGISPEICDRIFEPFFTTKEAGKGTGLGLATAFGIVTQHGGTIEVESSPGLGAIFIIDLPAAPESEVENALKTSSEIERGKGETILIVEDELHLRELINSTLTRNGYRVLAASSGAEAQRIPREQLQEVRVLLTDLVMPGGVGGRELALWLRASYPAMHFIFCSGYSSEVAGRRFYPEQDGIFLQKPFALVDLLRAISNSLH